MSRTHHPRKRTPPRRLCRDCGGHVYSWTPDPLCPRCVAGVEPAGDRGEVESLAAFRRRVIDPDRGLRDA